MNILELNEKIDYEVLLLEQILAKVSSNMGLHYRYTIAFLNHAYKQHEHHLFDSLGDSKVNEFIRDQLMPLVFLESFKVIDMFIEYTISNNLLPSERSPYKFRDKVNLLEQHFASGLTLHPHLDMAVFKGLFYVYKFYVGKRNAIVHRQWGSTSNGDMCFSDDGTTLQYSDIITFASTVLLLVEILNTSPNDLYFPTKIAGLQSNLACLQVAEYRNANINCYLNYDIVYTVEGDELGFVGVGLIEEKIQPDLDFWNRSDAGRQYLPIYTVKAVAGIGEWRIPSNMLTPLVEDGKVLENKLSEYKLN